jgi:hypothetical protein
MAGPSFSLSQPSWDIDDEDTSIVCVANLNVAATANNTVLADTDWPNQQNMFFY